MRRQRRKLAEAAAETRQILVADVLIAKEDHAVIEEGVPNLGNLLGIQFASKIDAEDLCPERPGQRPNFNMRICRHDPSRWPY
jgi:hypothetical protein